MTGAQLDMLMLLVMAFSGCIFMLKGLLVDLTRALHKDVEEYYEECNWTSEGKDEDEI